MLIKILYVDDCLLVGDKLAIESGLNNINRMFNVTITKNVIVYLGCRILNEKKRRDNCTPATHLQTSLRKNPQNYRLQK